MNDPGLNNLLKWGIQNSKASQQDPTVTEQPRTDIDQEALRRLISGMSGPSDADLMKESMVVIQNPEAELEARIIAFENFEQLIQNLDNANNIAPLNLWMPLIEQLDNEHAELRELAAWSCATAVQNNVQTQERLLILNALPKLVQMATSETNKAARKKAILALSSAVRNYQPALDATLSTMPAEFKPKDALDANDMDSVDLLINKLRERVATM